MPWYQFVWDSEAGGNVEHLAEHGLTPEDVEPVVMDPDDTIKSRTSGRPAVRGFTSDGRYIFVVFEFLDEDETTVYVHSAYEVD